MIDQMTVGHQFLDRTFGYNPRIGWQVRQRGSEALRANSADTYTPSLSLLYECSGDLFIIALLLT